MTRDIRHRLSRALDRGELRSAGNSLSPAMRERLERALYPAADPGDGGTPLPRVYTAARLAGEIAADRPTPYGGTFRGREIENERGRIQQFRWRVPLAALEPVQDLEVPAGSAGVLAALLENPDLADFTLKRALFLDTETTGLAGGTGTYVFLLGLGWIERGDFVVEQLFLRDFEDEGALLYRAGELAERFEVLVSFNGRRYDLPLLDTRTVLNRLPPGFGTRPHLDLLQPARLLYSGTFENCRLQTLERELLGQHREGDVPGEEIPRLYFAYLTGGDPLPLTGVFEHNFLDVVTLLTLTAHFLHLCCRPELDPRALAGLGRLHGRRGDRETALTLLEEARSRRAASYRDLRDLGLLYKRTGEYSKALEVWKSLIARQERVSAELGFDATPYVEAAKHYEHRNRDFTRALEMTTAALTQADATGNGHVPSTRLRRELDHRAARLRRFLEKESSGRG